MVPAAALPAWPPPTNPTAHRSAATYPTSAPPARSGGSAAPLGQRDLASTVYGGTEGPGFATVSLPQANQLENSGSLTGHILAQGWAEDAPAARSRNTRVVIVLAAALGLLVAVSVLVVLLADDAVSGLTGNLLTK
ncbi:hypothetical protein MRQ36_14525 [Micromonospora sp. R77]|uniref:hypothetical protein n=1 Tax=Micromonospora sp. R77 TaxID=2925836 RepID=UPI001F6220D6|nr:hypothetical protein [Micromonospora sp. R77]MCI4063734.1 hypothetical protein [Micromonospora sp. R77]